MKTAHEKYVEQLESELNVAYQQIIYRCKQVLWAYLACALLATMIPLAYYAGRRSVQVPALRVTATVREEVPTPRVLIYPHIENL